MPGRLNVARRKPGESAFGLVRRPRAKPERVIVITPPSLISYTATTMMSTTTPKTVNATVQVGDVIVVVGTAENGSNTLGLPSDGVPNTYTQQKLIDDGTISTSLVGIWTAVASSATTITVSQARTAGTGNWGMAVYVWRGASVGSSAASAAGVSGAPTLNLTTTQQHSAIVVANNDYNAVDGTTRTWRANAGTLTEDTYERNSVLDAVYTGHHLDAGAIGTYAVGLSAPTGQLYSIVALEIKGAVSGGVTSNSITGFDGGSGRDVTTVMTGNSADDAHGREFETLDRPTSDAGHLGETLTLTTAVSLTASDAGHGRDVTTTYVRTSVDLGHGPDVSTALARNSADAVRGREFEALDRPSSDPGHFVETRTLTSTFSVTASDPGHGRDVSTTLGRNTADIGRGLDVSVAFDRSSTDQAHLGETSTEAQTRTGTDAGHGVDASVALVRNTAEMGHFAEASTLTTSAGAFKTASDIGHGADTSTTLARNTLDTSRFAESTLTALSIVSGDRGHGGDSQTSRSDTSTDTGHGGESRTLSVATTAHDGGHESEFSGVGARTVSAVDAGHLTETSTVAGPSAFFYSASDAGHFAEGRTLTVTMAASDQGHEGETGVSSLALARVDVGHGVETRSPMGWASGRADGGAGKEAARSVAAVVVSFDRVTWAELSAVTLTARYVSSDTGHWTETSTRSATTGTGQGTITSTLGFAGGATGAVGSVGDTTVGVSSPGAASGNVGTNAGILVGVAPDGSIVDLHGT